MKKVLGVLIFCLIFVSAYADETLYNDTYTIALQIKDTHAGAITGLWIYTHGDINLVDNNDKGRQIQMALVLNRQCEAYNPTEAGASKDKPWGSSSSVLASVIKSPSNVVFTAARPAYWAAPLSYIRSGPPDCHTPGTSVNTTIVSKEVFYKRITVGIGAGVLQRIIKYELSMTAGDNYSNFDFECPTGYHPGMFEKFYEYTENGWSEIPQTADVGYTVTEYGVNQCQVISTSSGDLAIGVWSPKSVMRGGRYDNNSITKWNATQYHYNVSSGQTISAVSYMVLGSLSEVQSIMQNYVINKLY